MYALTLILGAIGAIAALLARFEPSEEELRIRQARRQLKRAGIRYPKNSPEEVQALRTVLEGGAPAEC